MHVTDSYLLLYYILRTIGAAPYKIKIVKNVKVVCESKFYLKYSKIIYFVITLVTMYDIPFNISDLSRLKNKISIIFNIIDLFIGRICIYAPSIIILHNSKLLCNIQNNLNELFAGIVSEKNEKLKNLRNINNFFLMCDMTVLILVFFCNFMDKNKNFPKESFFHNFCFVAFHSITHLVKFIPAIQYFALVNIIRCIYSNISNTIHLRPAEVSIKNIRIIDDTLKDIFYDINSVFSNIILLVIVRAFMLFVNGTVLLITQAGNILTLDFIVWIIYLIFYLGAIIKITLLTSAEVI